MLTSAFNNRINKFHFNMYHEIDENTTLKNTFFNSAGPIPRIAGTNACPLIREGGQLGFGIQDRLYMPGNEPEFHKTRLHLLNLKMMLSNQLSMVENHLNHKRNTKTKHRRAMELIRFKAGQVGKYLHYNKDTKIYEWRYAKVVADSRKFITIQDVFNFQESTAHGEFPIIEKCKKEHFVPIFGDELEEVNEEIRRLDLILKPRETKDCIVCMENKDSADFWKPTHALACEHDDVCKACVFNMRESYRPGYPEEWKNRTPCAMCRNPHWTKGFVML